MRARGGWRWLLVPLVVCVTTVAMVSVVVPSARAARPGTVKTVPVQQLSNRVEKLIRTVEGSTLACPTRNMVVRALRAVDDALLSGRRSAARSFAQAWTQHAWSLESGRVLSPEMGSALQTQLGGMVDQIGFGWPVKTGPTKHWKQLPSCDSGVVAAGAGAAASGWYTPYAATDLSSDIEIIVGALVSYVPIVGNLLYALTYLLWPASSTTDSWSQMASTATYNLVSAVLGNLKNLMTGSTSSWNDMMSAFNAHCPNWSQSTDCLQRADDLWTQFQIKENFFTYNRGSFQDFLAEPQAGHTTKGLDLLPLYAQYENMYLSLLRDGMQMHDRYWVNLGHDADDLAGTSMAKELNPNYLNPQNHNAADRGIGYVNSMYKYGLTLEPVASADDWGERNLYIRTETLTVLDYRDTWKYLDPRVFADGVPGGVKLTRMIYSDSTGKRQATPNLPTNVGGPLKEFSVWTKPVADGGTYVFRNISSAQATSPPLLGPAQSGPITGGTANFLSAASYFNLSAAGPISQVRAQSHVSGCIGRQQPVPSWVGFYWAKGGHTDVGSYTGSATSVFQYDGEVLANVQVISRYDVGSCGGHVGDSVVFGFRYADSFNPTGEVVGVGSGKCLDLPSWTNATTHVVIHSCYQPPTPAQIWTYDPSLQQISVTNPAEWSDNNPTDSGKHCLDTLGGGTAPDTPVVINACNDNPGATTGPTASSQRWTIEAVGGNAAKITNVKSGMAVEVDLFSSANGAGLVLGPYIGEAAQKWKASDPLTGEIHNIGSGRCVDVPGASATPGTQVQIYDCNGTNAQQWTYNSTNNELIYAAHPSLCLEARGGGTATGTAVQINTCTGAANQQWKLGGDGSWISTLTPNVVMDVTGGNDNNGTLIQLNSANGTQAQQWSRTSSQGGALHAVAAAKCLDLPTSGTSLVIQTCASPRTAAQTWTYHPIAQTFTVSSAPGLVKCLDTAGGGTTAGTVVVINDCTGAASQRWTRNFSQLTITNVNSIQYKPDGSLASVMVLGVTGGATANGTTVELTSQPLDAQGNLLTPAKSQQWAWSLS